MYTIHVYKLSMQTQMRGVCLLTPLELAAKKKKSFPTATMKQRELL